MKCAVNNQKAWAWQESELRTIPCPICSSHDLKIVYPRADNLEIVSCNNCLFRFIQPQPSQRELNRFYQQGYFSGGHDFHQGDNYFDSRNRAITTEQVTGWQFLKSNIELSQKKLLDLGCADGALLVLARQYGATEVIGVEVSEEAATCGRDRYGLEILTSSADRLCFADGTFNVVTAFDLIEHVCQPAQLFEEVHRVLSVGGVFVGGCPDMGCFDDWKAEWIGVRRNMEHLSYFSDRALSHLAEKVGFKVTLLQYQGFPLELKQYSNLHKSRITKALQPNVWIYNVWQKLRFKAKQSQHRHELMFILQKL